MASKSLKQHRHLIDKRVRIRLGIYLIISLILLCIVIFNIFRGALDVNNALLGVVAGTGVGIIFSRMFRTSWDKNAKKVISQLDTFGFGILLLYIVFEVLRDDIVKFFTDDRQVATTGFAVLAGVILGQVIGLRGRIIEILQEQKAIKK